MKTLLTNIINIFKTVIPYLKKLQAKDWVIVGLVIGMIVLGFTTSHYYNLSQERPDVIYSNDSIDYYKNKHKDLYVQNEMLDNTLTELKNENRSLYDEIQNLKDHPITVTNTEILVHTDTIYMKSDSIINNDEIHHLYWHQAETNGYYNITGQTNVRTDFTDFSTSVNSLNIPVDITSDIIEKDDKLYIITHSNNPYVTIQNSQGVFLDPTESDVIKSKIKTKRWSFGPSIGYSLNKDWRFSPYIGIGLHYGIIVW